MKRALKYIICDLYNEFTLLGGYVLFHSDLIPSKKVSSTHVYGGGYFKIDDDNKKVILYGESVDFGEPSYKQIENAIKLEQTRKNNFLSELWMIMYLYYRSQGCDINEDDIPDYTKYKISFDQYGK